MTSAFFAQHSDAPLVRLRLAKVEGSSYQPVGAQKWVAADRSCVGMITGGCLDDHLTDIALAEPLTAARTWQQVVDSTLAEDRILGSGLGCRGRLTITFEVLPSGCPRRQQLIAEHLSPDCTVHIVGGGYDVDAVVRLIHWRGWGARVYARTPAEQQRLKAAAIPSQLLKPEDITGALTGSPKILVLMTHHFPTDVALLAQLAADEAPLDYLGVLGSRQRIQALRDDLHELHGRTLPPALEAVLHGPLGLEGFGKGEKAVALALVSQLQLLFGSPSAHSGR